MGITDTHVRQRVNWLGLWVLFVRSALRGRSWSALKNIFLYQNEDDLTFFGASPEILIETKSNQLLTMALAGTIKRDDDHLKDIELSKKLLKNKKEQ